VNIVVQLAPRDGAAPKTVYTWDADTDILSASVRLAPAKSGKSGSVEVEGTDGSWIILDLLDEHISGVEIAVWPGVTKREALAMPPTVQDAAVRVPAGGKAPAVTAFEVEIPMSAETDAQERNFHFRLGVPRETSAVRVAQDLLLDVDATNHVAGVWLLNVPPFPDEP